MKHYIFDVDGTLTPSRQPITLEFKEFFLEFCKTHKCHVVTGSDHPKTLEQLGDEVCDALITIYNCSGNDVWFRRQRVSKSDWRLPTNLEHMLKNKLNESPFELRTGNHIEHRIGSVNFSIVGRNANQTERKMYVEYDQQNKERERIAKQINMMFYGIEAMVGGDTGIDIYPQGKNKSQIIDDFDGHELYFFGDKMEEGGNDLPLAKVILDKGMGECYHVKDYVETWAILREICNNE